MYKAKFSLLLLGLLALEAHANINPKQLLLDQMIGVKLTTEMIL